MSVQALSCAMVIRGVTASEKLLLLVMANYADDRMQCWPSHKTLSDDTCLSQRTILSLLKGLEDKKLISRRERFRADGSRSSDVITLHFSGEVASPRGEEDDVGVGKSATPGGAIISPLTTFEPTTEPSSSASARERDDWPTGDLRILAEQLANAAGPGLGDPAKEPGLTQTLAELHRWRTAGCSWALDVVPTIQARTLKPRARRVGSWRLFTTDILGAKEARLAAPTLSGDATEQDRRSRIANWTTEQWAAAVKLHSETGRWSERLGPEPGQPGCQVPVAALSAA